MLMRQGIDLFDKTSNIWLKVSTPSHANSWLLTYASQKWRVSDGFTRFFVQERFQTFVTPRFVKIASRVGRCSRIDSHVYEGTPSLLTLMARWTSGRALDSQLDGCEFDSRPPPLYWVG